MNTTLITGASDGIGRAIAIAFAKKKHHLLLLARNEKKLATLCQELQQQYHIDAQYLVADLCKPEVPLQVYKETIARGLSIDLLINNAGRGSSGEFYLNNLEAALEMIQLNNASLVALTHLFVKDMIAQKAGRIINVASLAAFFPSPYMSVYAASKHFVKTFTYSLAAECQPYHVNVMLFSPGLTSSGFMLTQENNNKWGKVLTSNARIQTPEQVATELINAYEKKKSTWVSGRQNRLFVKISGLLAPRFVAKTFAKQKRKQMGFK